ncbi:sugar dehydrogenase complex small subunit [Achromobacter aloeverae]|uniref:Sorbitol dehydrogenase n=1 Tax=Achromobacter aloeverae TaxID=1750518 RepID=A0A4Q1HD54_9BURK|nr:sugar dehydrogenase complex small subunit [Achromobacter aloeverae]RXN83755.1 hypothetical protein C7R54_26150 [Achromobacter aloeverae]
MSKIAPSRVLTAPASYARRDLLMAALTSVVTLAAPTWSTAAWAQAPDTDASGKRFLDLSRFLTGKDDLDPVIARRTLQALLVEKDFEQRYAALESACQAARQAGTLTGMDAFDASPVGKDPALRATAVEIVSAWYLGRVGSGPATQLIAYREALMYRPTAGITTVPSYQLGGYGYWTPKPVLPAA